MGREAILVVDDNATNLKLVRLLLAGEGYEVFAANDAEEALQILEVCRPRLLLTDIQLPGIDGLELTRRVKSDPLHGGLIVVALSAYAMKGDEEKALAAGCNGYITKPIDPDRFPATVAQYLAIPIGSHGLKD